MLTLFTSIALACQCSGSLPLADAALVAAAVLEARVVAVNADGSLDLEVVASIDGPSGGTLRIWGDSGKSCRPSIVGHKVGATYIFAAEPLPAGESTPGGVAGDWALPVCTTPSARVSGGRVSLPGATKPAEVWMEEWRAQREALVIKKRSQLHPKLLVVVEGERVATKSGAALLVDGVPVYVAGREWTDAELGATARAKGRLSREAYLPPPALAHG